jgi:hypothetical protein
MRLFNIFRQKPAYPDLEDRLELCERQLKAIRLEWEDTYERITRLMGRIAKRQALEARRAETAEDAPEDAIPEQRELDPFSQKILAQRHARRQG